MKNAHGLYFQNWMCVLCLAGLFGLTVQTAQAAPQALVDGKFGKAVDLSSEVAPVTIRLGQTLAARPVTLECWVRINSTDAYNIIMAAAPKSGAHWEVFTLPGSGLLSVFIPQMGDGFRGTVALKTGQWHFIAFRLLESGCELFVDGKPAGQSAGQQRFTFDQSPLLLGGIEGESLRMDGAIDDLRISRKAGSLEGYIPDAALAADATTLSLFHFDELKAGRLANAASADEQAQAEVTDRYAMPKGNRFLDEVQDEEYAKSTLHGDAMVEWESRLPAQAVAADSLRAAAALPAPRTLSLSGEWLLKECKPRLPADVEKSRIGVEESEGVKGQWFKEGFDRSSWRKVQVPTTVQSALVKLGELPDPLWDTNTYSELQERGQPKSIHWIHRRTTVEQQDWWFARAFDAPREWQGQSVRLYFDGIDYAGSVYLNGKPLGYHEGMFGGPAYDITGIVRFDRPNEVVVSIDKARDTWFGNLKGSPGFGWHYGHLISMGIWRDVRLECVPAAELAAPFVRTVSLTADRAVLKIQYDIQNQGEPVKLEITGTVKGNNFEGEQKSFLNAVTAQRGLNRFATELTIKNPKAWWPVNYGDPNLYELQLALASKGKKPHDGKAVTFGVRTVAMLPLAGTQAEKDYRWQFVINGVPLFIKGANWCWTDPMLQCDPAKYQHFLELARRGGIQMFRSWGGGIIETDEFYRLCDEKGLMVYQEFPYCWGPPDFPLTSPQVLDQQVSSVVKRNRNHPSLVMWGGGNENVAPTGSDEELFLVGRRCRQYDPSRPFHRTSPWGGSVHNWSVFHNGAPIDSSFMSLNVPWYGEFGLPSFNSWEEALKFLPESKLNAWPPAQDDGGIQSHMNQFGFGDMVKVMRYCDYGPITSWKTYMEYSQMAQGDEIGFAANQMRAGSYFNKGGLWFYKMSDLFPGQSWAIVGFYGFPKLSYYRARQVYRPQAAYAHYRQYNWDGHAPFEATLHVNNDSRRPLENVKVRAVIYGSDWSELWSREYAVKNVPLASRQDLDEVKAALDPAKTQPFLMAVSMRGADGGLISDQWYWFNWQVKTDAVREMEKLPAWGWPHERAPEAFKAYGSLPEARLLSLPRTRLAVSLSREGKKGSLVIRNEGDCPAFNVIIDHFPYEYGTYLDDNSFSLYPHEERVIGFELTRDAQTLAPVTVHAWNADEAKVR